MQRIKYCKTRQRLAATLILGGLLSIGVHASATESLAKPDVALPNVEDRARQYTFAWQFLEGADMSPRGGTTSGPPIELIKRPSQPFLSMTDADVRSVQRDRLAILAMAGEFRTSFDFLETVGFTEDYSPAKPYQSWGTEYVFVVEEQQHHIALQHILVMKINLPSGEVSDPMVIKHWRQDWTFEPSDISVYIGNQTWQTRELGESETTQMWRQSVYQVDDSPRYQALGRWRHYSNYSSWHSEETWRPLPRREFSVRQDYDVLVGTNKHTIDPTGWVQEEENLKVVLNSAGVQSIVAKEVGLARYQRIQNWDWTAGKDYWARTSRFWSLVRDQWASELNTKDDLQISNQIEGVPLYAAMFRLAETTQDYETKRLTEEISVTLGKYIKR